MSILKNLELKLTEPAYISAFLILSGVIIISLCGCSGNSDTKREKADNDYHADNDIAMTMRSIVDAISVGQDLDSTDYNYRGILTDGTGRPLYTDIQGAPGEWEIRVNGNRSVSLRNLYLGDLLPEELTQYILESLQMNDSTLIASGIAGNDPDAEVKIYDFGRGELIFETKTAMTGDGERGPLLNIAVRAK